MITEPMPIAEVSAEDREAAAKVYRGLYHQLNATPSHAQTPDDDDLIQAFARHRLTALADAERKLEDARAALEKAGAAINCAFFQADAERSGNHRKVSEYDEIITDARDAIRAFLAAQDGGKG